MNYYELFNLGGEPFSNSPDPDFFFRARSHAECLNAVEIAVRLKRGLNVVLGDVGVGKSTICRELLRNLAADPAVRTHLLLDPYFSSASEFLRVLRAMLCGAEAEPGASDWQLKEAIKVALLKAGVADPGAAATITVLVLDEGQKIRRDCLELLREFLNYETNSEKLLQIVVFAQTELQDTLRAMPNLADRVNLLVRLAPLGLSETVAMIRFRLDRVRTGYASRDLFTWPAYWAIHRAAGGYPRKIVTLCHRALLALIVQNGTRVRLGLVRGLAGELAAARGGGRTAWRPALWTAALALALGAVLVLPPGPRLGQLGLRPGGPPAVPVPAAPPAPEAGARDGSAGIVRAPVREAEPGPAQAAAQAARPDLLGRLVLLRQERVSDLMLLVYGASDRPRLQRLAQANPQIQSLDRVPGGSELAFPAFEAPADQSPAGLFWLRLAAGQDDLGRAFDQVRTLRKAGAKARLLVHWSRDDGLRCEVVSSSPYPTREAAARGLSGLPAEFAAGAEVIGGWDRERLFFSTTKPARPGREP